MTQRLRTTACSATLAALLLTAPLRAQPAAPPAQAAGSAAAPLAPASAAPVTTAPGNVAAQKTVTVLGLGMVSCKDYAAMQQLGAGDIVNQWLLGFLSGGGAFAGSNYLASTSMADAIKLVQHYCAANLAAKLAVAGLEVAQELEGPLGPMRPK